MSRGLAHADDGARGVLHGGAPASGRIISEAEFAREIRRVLALYPTDEIGCVVGPGRSGAVAAVYASHILAVPFIPYGAKAPLHLGRLLIIDTAVDSGRTLRKAARKYDAANKPIIVAVYDEPPRVSFWYEATKPQRYRHEMRQPVEIRFDADGQGYTP